MPKSLRLTHFSWGKIGVMVLLRAKNWHFTTLLQAPSKATETLSKSYRTLLAISFILIFQPCWRAYLDKMFATNQEGAIFWRTFCKIPWDCICAEISTCAKIIFWYISDIPFPSPITFQIYPFHHLLYFRYTISNLLYISDIQFTSPHFILTPRTRLSCCCSCYCCVTEKSNA